MRALRQGLSASEIGQSNAKLFLWHYTSTFIENVRRQLDDSLLIVSFRISAFGRRQWSRVTKNQ